MLRSQDALSSICLPGNWLNTCFIDFLPYPVSSSTPMLLVYGIEYILYPICLWILLNLSSECLPKVALIPLTSSWLKPSWTLGNMYLITTAMYHLSSLARVEFIMFKFDHIFAWDTQDRSLLAFQHGPRKACWAYKACFDSCLPSQLSFALCTPSFPFPFCKPWPWVSSSVAQDSHTNLNLKWFNFTVCLVSHFSWFMEAFSDT